MSAPASTMSLMTQGGGSETVVVVFEHMAVWIHLSDDLLRTVATWRGTSINAEDRVRMRSFAQGFSTLHCLPKVCVEWGSAAEPYRVTGECAAPCAQGMADEQLDRGIVISLAACLKVMDALAQEFPHCVTWLYEEG